MGMRRWLLWLPLAVFAIVVVFAVRELRAPADRTVYSAMVGKPVPDFQLDPIVAGKPGLSDAALRTGQPRLLNVFASWCVPCIAEAPQLMQLKAMGVPIDAVAIRDTGPAVAQFLKRYGDPYQRIGDDRDSRVQLSLGSSGVPETFVIDGKGRQREAMPLPESAGHAMLDWLEKGRPQCDCPYVFVRLRRPYQALNLNSGISTLVQAELRKQGVRRSGAAHVFRHSFARQHLKGGLTLPQIGRLLRHRIVDTTQIYTKVDDRMLAALAQDWPGEAA